MFRMYSIKIVSHDEYTVSCIFYVEENIMLAGWPTAKILFCKSKILKLIIKEPPRFLEIIKYYLTFQATVNALRQSVFADKDSHIKHQYSFL